MKTDFGDGVMRIIALLCIISAGMGTGTALVLLVQGRPLMAFAVFVGTFVALLVAIVLAAIMEEEM